MEGQVSYDYAKFPREFVSYQWFKPILVALLTFALYLAFSIALMLFVILWTGDVSHVASLATGYDDMDTYTGPGALLELGGIAMLLPALALASVVVRDRPFSSYSSSRGGWNWGAFARCLLVAAAVMAVSSAVEYALAPASAAGVSRFTAVGLALCVALVPVQCLAEEYLFRAFLLQTFASWTRLPAVGIVVSAALFAAGHPYNVVGVIAIFCNGLVWGLIAWKTRGLEATSALHIANNMVAFLATGFGLDEATSTISVESLAVAIAVDIVYAAVVLLLGERRGWFSSRGDGVARFNEERAAQMGQERRRTPEPPRLVDASAAEGRNS